MNQGQGKPVCEDSDIEIRYQRAQTIIQGYTTQNLVQNDAVFPHWIEETGCFWYERSYQIHRAAAQINPIKSLQYR